MEETSTEAMVNTGATGDFIDQDFVTQEKLPTANYPNRSRFTMWTEHLTSSVWKSGYETGKKP